MVRKESPILRTFLKDWVPFIQLMFSSCAELRPLVVRGGSLCLYAQRFGDRLLRHGSHKSCPHNLVNHKCVFTRKVLRGEHQEFGFIPRAFYVRARHCHLYTQDKMKLHEPDWQHSTGVHPETKSIKRNRQLFGVLSALWLRMITQHYVLAKAEC